MLTALLVSACGGAAPSPRSAAAAEQATSPEPHHKTDTLMTSDGLVTVTIPAEGQWQCVADQAETPSVAARWIRCELASSEPLFFLMAKDYSVPAEAVLPAQKLFARHFERNYERMFTRFTYRSRSPIDHDGHPGYEVVLDGTQARHGDVRLRERAMVLGRHVLLLTAQGGAADFGRLEPTVEHWFSQSRFATLERERARRTAQLLDRPALAAPGG